MLSVLMATYNGDKYLKEQLNSLLSQTFRDFSILVSDDASTDCTWNILLSYKAKFPHKIFLSRRDKNSGNAKYNFLDMMTSVKDDYIMLCDQDDVWMPQKIEKTLRKMKETERMHPGRPVLVHTDMRVVDRDLRTISHSYRESMNSNFNRTALHQVLIQNTFAGCSAMYNRPLAELLAFKPEYCIMHDWWLELVAATFGIITHIDDTTMLYRQHGNNEVGAKDVRKLSYKINRLLHGGEVKEAIRITYPQAESLLNCYESLMTREQKSIIQSYCNIPKVGRLSRWRTICTLGAYKNGLSRNIAYFLFV